MYTDLEKKEKGVDFLEVQIFFFLHEIYEVTREWNITKIS